MATKSAASVWFEYAALRTACAVVNAVPYPVADMFAKGIARFAFDVCGFRRRRTVERIRGCFPEKSEAEARRIARFSLYNVLMTAVEMIRAPRFDRAWIDRHVEDMPEYAGRLKKLVDEGKGVVIFVPHAGNWYMAAWAMAQYGLRLCAIAAKQRNPKIDAWMKRQYGTIEVVERGSARVMHEIREMLAGGRAFAILPDLRVPRPDVAVPFLNGTANVSRGGATFAVDAGCPLVVAMMRRRNGRHVFDHLATLRPDPAADSREEARRLTREAMALLDGAVRSTPEQWFWFNKRWILQPVTV